MKTLQLLTLFLFTSAFLNAQITINSDVDLVSAGDTVIQSYDDNISSFSPGGTGQQSWDFSSLTDNGNLDSLIFIDISQVPDHNLFPGANLGLKIINYHNGNTDTIFQYIETSAAYLHILGMYASQYNDVHYLPFQNIMPFPVTYGDEYYSDYVAVVKAFNGVDSIMIKSYENDTIKIDAYGPITIPRGTYESLRFYHNSYRSDSSFIKMGSNWIFNTVNNYPSDSYVWWTNDPTVKMKVLEFQTDEQGAVTGGNFANEIFLHNSSIQNLTDNSNLIITNSGNGNILIKNIPKKYNKVHVYNIEGKQVRVKQINSDSIELNVQNLSAGVYIVSISSPSGTIGKKVKIK